VILYITHKKFDGEIVLLSLGGYGLGRFWIEGLRTDQLIMHTTGLPVSQMLALCLVVFSVTAMIIKRLKMREK
jgi:phosphatidylglycerol:prolipoprotein diacylglycerol transferase